MQLSDCYFGIAPEDWAGQCGKRLRSRRRAGISVEARLMTDMDRRHLAFHHRRLSCGHFADDGRVRGKGYLAVAIHMVEH
jgi:hypothetical protein